MATLGSLIVTLEANIAKFQTDLGKAVTMAEASMTKISRAIGEVQAAFGLLAGGFGAIALVTFEMKVVSAAAHLQELRAETGLTVNALSAIGNIAMQAGGSVDEAAKSFDKMEKNAASAASGNRTMAAAFASVGMTAAQLTAGLKDPDALILQIAQHMEKYADDGNKTATMMTLFGRAGAAQIEMLHKLAEEGFSLATVTALQAENAKKFEIELANMSTWVKQLGLDIAMGLIPKIKLVGTALITGFSDAWITVKYDFEITLAWMQNKLGSWAQTITNILTTISLGSVVPMGAIPHITLAPAANIETLKKARDDAHALNESIRKEAAADYVLATQGPGAQAAVRKLPSIKIPPHDDKLKGQKDLLSATLAMMNEQMRVQEAIVKTANAQTDADYKNGLTSLAQYSTDKYVLLDKSAKDTAEIYTREIAAAVKYMNILAAGPAKDAENHRAVRKCARTP